MEYANDHLMSVLLILIVYLPKTVHIVRKAMTTSKDGMRNLIRYVFLPSETKIKSTFQWKGDSFVMFAIYITSVLLHIVCPKPFNHLTVGTAAVAQ